nr:uncharacterized protein LOC127330482 [Lolium perenne]
MATGARGSSRKMEPPPGFTSTPMHPPMPWGMPRTPAPNGAPHFAPPPFSRSRARRQPTAPSAPRFPTAATTTYQTTGAPAPPSPPPGCGVRCPQGHAGAGARPPPQSGPLSHHPIVSTSIPLFLIDDNVDVFDDIVAAPTDVHVDSIHVSVHCM